MSEKEKGSILSQVHKLPPLQKARALGFMQGLAAANADKMSALPKDDEDAEKEG